MGGIIFTDSAFRHVVSPMSVKLKKIPPLPPDASDDEVIDWTLKYDLVDRLRTGVTEEVEDHSAEEAAAAAYLASAQTERNTAQLNLRLAPSLKNLLTRLARQRTTDPATLARTWLVERIQQEIGTVERIRRRAR